MVRRSLSLLGLATAVLILGFVTLSGRWKRQSLDTGGFPTTTTTTTTRSVPTSTTLITLKGVGPQLNNKRAILVFVAVPNVVGMTLPRRIQHCPPLDSPGKCLPLRSLPPERVRLERFWPKVPLRVRRPHEERSSNSLSLATEADPLTGGLGAPGTPRSMNLLGQFAIDPKSRILSVPGPTFRLSGHCWRLSPPPKHGAATRICAASGVRPSTGAPSPGRARARSRTR